MTDETTDQPLPEDLPEDFDPAVEVEESQWVEGTSPYDDDFPGHQDPEATYDSEVGVEELSEDHHRLLAAIIRSGAAAMAWARAHISWHPSGMCLVFSRSAFNVGAYYGTAALAWLHAVRKHHCTSGSQVPAGVPVFWTGGSHGAGHIAISLGGGYCRSTDWPSSGRVSTARIDDITRAWRLHFQGWTEDVNRVTVYHGAPTPVSHAIDLRHVVKAVKADPHGKITHGVLLKKAVAAEVGQGDMVLNNAVLGKGFIAQYAHVQRKYLESHGLPVRKGDADGVPGKGSLTWLGARHGFSVRD